MNLNNIMLSTSNPKILGDFYEKVFNRKPDMGEGEGWYGWKVGDGFLGIGEHSEVHGQAKEPQRIILNFEVQDIENEFKRIKNIEEIKVEKELYEMEGMKGMWIATFSDPDGNYFQLMSPWENK